MTAAKQSLKLAGGLSLGMAVFQAAISFSPSASQYFDAPPELVANPPMLIVAGLAMAGVLMVFGLYAFSGAGCLRRLPWLRLGLLISGSLYTLRGLFSIPELLIFLGFLPLPQPLPPQELVASLVSLVIGLLYLAGTLRAWRSLSRLAPLAA